MSEVHLDTWRNYARHLCDVHGPASDDALRVALDKVLLTREVDAEVARQKMAAEAERLKKLVWGAVHNAGRTGDRRPRWVAVKGALGVGSTTATALCVAHGLDPDEEVGRVPECGCCGAKEGTPCDDDCDVEAGA